MITVHLEFMSINIIPDFPKNQIIGDVIIVGKLLHFACKAIFLDLPSGRPRLVHVV